MPTAYFFSPSIPLLSFGVLVALTGCFFDERAGSRGRLSDAVEKSRDGTHDRTVPARRESNPSPPYSSAPSPDEIPLFTLSSRGESTKDSDDVFSIGAFSYYTNIDDENVKHIAGGGIYVRVDSDDGVKSGGLSIAGEYYDIATNSSLDLGIKDVNAILVNGYFRRHFNTRKPFLSPFIGGSLGFGSMFWDYKNTLRDDEGKIIEGDSLGFVEGELYLGMDAWRRRGLTVSGQVGGVIRLYGFYTSQDFENDILAASSGIKVSLAIGGRF
jgi:hypothetical protein